MDYDRWLLNQAAIHEERNGKMGYRSQVVVELKGKPEDVMVVLNTYKLSESPQEIEAAHHILDTGAFKADFFVEQTDDHLELTWMFDDVKWYTESVNAFDRLANIVEEMGLEVALYLTRVGEDAEDIETQQAGDVDEYERAAYVQTSIQTDCINGETKNFSTYKIGGASA